MKTQARDLLVLIDDRTQPKKAIESLGFVPALRLQQLSTLPEPDELPEEPLVYLVGSVAGLADSSTLPEWMEQLRTADAAPVALLLPQNGYLWCAGTTHPQFCGLLPWFPEIQIEAMERILHEARRNLARRWGQGTVSQARLNWTLSTREAADSEQAWLLIESVLAHLVGPSVDLSCLGMAFAEALTNAVEHGNLELDSSLKDSTSDGLFRFFEERERRLADGRFSRRRVRVGAEVQGAHVRVQVRNEGRGFRPQSPATAENRRHPGANPYGLGLSMIESLVDDVRISPDGRTITLFHSVPQERWRTHGVIPNPLDEDTTGLRAA